MPSSAKSRTTLIAIGFGRTGERSAEVPRRPLWRENLIWLELASMLRELRHPREPCSTDVRSAVLMVPGFLSGDRSLGLMKRWLQAMGHTAECAGIRWNIDCSSAAVDHLEQRLERFADAEGRPVTVIGQSRGGLLGRVLAVRRPDLVDRLVTLGSPHADPMRVHPALVVQGASLAVLGSLGVPGLLRWSCLNGECCDSFRRDLEGRFPAQTDFFSVYSRKDGIVDWRACLDPAAIPVHVDSTHCGMALSPDTYDFLDALLNRHEDVSRGRGSDTGDLARAA